MHGENIFLKNCELKVKIYVNTLSQTLFLGHLTSQSVNLYSSPEKDPFLILTSPLVGTHVSRIEWLIWCQFWGY